VTPLALLLDCLCRRNTGMVGDFIRHQLALLFSRPGAQQKSSHDRLRAKTFLQQAVVGASSFCYLLPARCSFFWDRILH
jgi:hypothetical protein